MRDTLTDARDTRDSVSLPDYDSTRTLGRPPEVPTFPALRRSLLRGVAGEAGSRIRPEAGGREQPELPRRPPGSHDVKLRELCRQLALDIRTAVSKLDTEVTGGYASDLLSHVIAEAQEGNLLITLQGHPNVVAVASLLDLAGVIISEGMVPDAVTLVKAEEKGIPIMTTPLTTYTVVGRLVDMGIPGVDEGNPSDPGSWARKLADAGCASGDASIPQG